MIAFFILRTATLLRSRDRTLNRTFCLDANARAAANDPTLLTDSVAAATQRYIKVRAHDNPHKEAQRLQMLQSFEVRVVERVEHVDQTIGEEKEEINIKHLFNIWRV